MFSGIEDIDNTFIQTYVFNTFVFNTLSTSRETEKGEEINRTKSNQETPNVPFSPWAFTVVGQSYKDVPLLETTPPFLLEEPSCQRIKMFFLAKNSKLIKLVVHFWTSILYEDSNLNGFIDDKLY